MTGTVRLTRRCNNRCPACPWACVVGATPPDEEPGRVLARLRELRAQGVQRVLLTGGEPTVAVTLGLVVAEARGLGFPEIAIATNGRRLADPRYADRLVRGGLTHAVATLHSHLAAVHDALTRTPGSFAETTDGIAALVARGVAVTSLHVLNRGTLADLRGYLELVRLLGVGGVALRRWGTGARDDSGAGGGRGQAADFACTDGEAEAAAAQARAYGAALGLAVEVIGLSPGAGGMRYYH